jgi:hypothetical protein
MIKDTTITQGDVPLTNDIVGGYDSHTMRVRYFNKIDIDEDQDQGPPHPDQDAIDMFWEAWDKIKMAWIDQGPPEVIRRAPAVRDALQGVQADLENVVGGLTD